MSRSSQFTRILGNPPNDDSLRQKCLHAKVAVNKRKCATLKKSHPRIFLYIYKATEMKRQEIKEPVLETNLNTKFVPDPEIEEIVTPLKKTLPGAE